MLEAASSNAEKVRIVCDDTDVFVLHVYGNWRKIIRYNIQMEKWDGTVLDIRATVDKLGDKCGQPPACTPCQAATPSPTLTARERSPLWRYWRTMTSMACNMSQGSLTAVRDSWRPLDVVSCSCSAEWQACCEERCSCHSAGLSCTEYCYCEGRCVLQSLQ